MSLSSQALFAFTWQICVCVCVCVCVRTHTRVQVHVCKYKLIVFNYVCVRGVGVCV